MKKEALKELLRSNGMRATKSRVDVLLFVEQQKHPVGVEVLKKAFPDINEVTLYRMASDFVEKRIWNACDLGHGHMDYESASKPCHHHVVCESCGKIEEVYSCETECQLVQLFEKQVKEFQSLSVPRATFFGVCNGCASV